MGGYRALFVFDLAERLYNLPGLKQRVLRDDPNEAQYFDRTKDFPLIRDGHIDVFLTYITNALVLIAVDKARKSGSQLTHRWREMDSNFRFRAKGATDLSFRFCLCPLKPTAFSRRDPPC
jgi:hypothetical protein